MKKQIKLLLVAGARPNFMKIAPLIWTIRTHNKESAEKSLIDYCLVHTGQHYDEKMSAVFFNDLNIPKPDINLEVGSGSHAQQTARIMAAFEPVCLKEKPDWVVVVGDVNSTMACTLVASKMGVKVAHIEAGLRSFDRTMPEEINRIVTDALADLLLTPSPDADENLKKEGIPAEKIRFVGNIMIDTLVSNIEKARKSTLPKQLNLNPNDFAYITLHRPSNVDDKDKLTNIMAIIDDLAHQLPVVFPVHPRTRKMLDQYRISNNGKPNLNIIEPIGYHDSLWLTEHACFILTDSGGLQEESTYFQIPCLTLRPNTERPITIQQGTNKLTSLETLEKDFHSVLNCSPLKKNAPAFWDGKTGCRIIEILSES